eukprot:TRINITY_DN6945_c0_g1_i1.p1 TRINITY_DN6945_c0_g1~~TRINITY_DN6945_c0_g1_i1.p1  ORF type:complete len:229 (-),score=47.48 TRINITY_DN6945_c0_g1_i1:244-861(-)
MKLLDRCYYAVTALFVAFGVGAYVGFDSKTAAPITLNLPQNGDRLSAVVKLTLCACLMCTYPIMLQPVCEIVERALRSYRASPVAINAGRMAAVACTAVVAILVPKFAHLMGIIGALGCTALAFSLPSYYYLRLFPGTTRARRLALYAIMLFGLLGGVFSAYLSFSSMIEEARAEEAAEMTSTAAITSVSAVVPSSTTAQHTADN